MAIKGFKVYYVDDEPIFNRAYSIEVLTRILNTVLERSINTSDISKIRLADFGVVFKDIINPVESENCIAKAIGADTFDNKVIGKKGVVIEFRFNQASSSDDGKWLDSNDREVFKDLAKNNKLVISPIGFGESGKTWISNKYKLLGFQCIKAKKDRKDYTSGSWIEITYKDELILETEEEENE